MPIASQDYETLPRNYNPNDKHDNKDKDKRYDGTENL